VTVVGSRRARGQSQSARESQKSPLWAGSEYKVVNRSVVPSPKRGLGGDSPGGEDEEASLSSRLSSLSPILESDEAADD